MRVPVGECVYQWETSFEATTASSDVESAWKHPTSSLKSYARTKRKSSYLWRSGRKRGRKAISSKWVQKVKEVVEGLIERYKAPRRGKGFLQQ